jgi:hypothetical protein
MTTAKKAADPPEAPEADVKEDPAHEPPTQKQQREMHALLRDHGIVSDDAVYAYLGSVLERDITSRKEVSRTEAARIIAELHADPYVGMTKERNEALRAPFPNEQIGHLPRITCKACRESQRKRCDEHRWIWNCDLCGGGHTEAVIHLSYVGHADLTDRLLSVDPCWTWRPWTPEELNAVPPAMRDGLWIWLTVCGVTRPGFGDADGKKGGNGVKEAIGDALRNAGMRFGIALDLWAKGDRDFTSAAQPDETTPAPQKPEQPPAQPTTPPPASPTPQQAPPPPTDDLVGKSTSELLLVLDKYGEDQGKTYGDFTEKWRESLGGISIDDLDNLAPEIVADQIRKVRAWLGK